MAHFDTTRRVAHSADEMFDLVADVEKYPEFLPLCQRLVVRTERERAGKNLLVADMTVAYKMVKETFSTQVLLKPDDRQIDVKYVDGPFRFLDNTWEFVPVGADSCDVKFVIDYEFKSRTLGLLMGSMFDYAFRRFAKAFEDRADQIYGTDASATA